MKKGVLIEADVDECRLQGGLEIADAALIYGADNAPGSFALDVVLFYATINDQSNPRLQVLGVYNDLFHEGKFPT